MILDVPSLSSWLLLLMVVAVFFSLLDYWHAVCEQQQKTNSPPPDLSTQGYCHWEAWDLLPDSLVGQVG